MSRQVRIFVAIIALAAAVACTKEDKAKAVDHSDPQAVVDAVFEAAKLADTTQLAGLCDPLGENDNDTKKICEVTKGSKMFGEFLKVFQPGRTVGRAKIEGNEARVPIMFGPDGNSDEEMRLISRDGKWYLSGF